MTSDKCKPTCASRYPYPDRPSGYPCDCGASSPEPVAAEAPEGGDSLEYVKLRGALQDQTDALCDIELSAERMKLTALRLRAVILAARQFAPVGNPVMFTQYETVLVAALRDLDEHDAHHGVSVHIDEAARRGLPTYASPAASAGEEPKRCNLGTPGCLGERKDGHSDECLTAAERMLDDPTMVRFEEPKRAYDPVPAAVRSFFESPAVSESPKRAEGPERVTLYANVEGDLSLLQTATEEHYYDRPVDYIRADLAAADKARADAAEARAESLATQCRAVQEMLVAEQGRAGESVVNLTRAVQAEARVRGLEAEVKHQWVLANESLDDKAVRLVVERDKANERADRLERELAEAKARHLQEAESANDFWDERCRFEKERDTARRELEEVKAENGRLRVCFDMLSAVAEVKDEGHLGFEQDLHRLSERLKAAAEAKAEIERLRAREAEVMAIANDSKKEAVMGDWADEWIASWCTKTGVIMPLCDRKELASELRRAERRGIERAAEVPEKALTGPHAIIGTAIATEIRKLLESDGRQG